MKKGLGKGLGALISIDENDEKNIKDIKINDIEPNINQPRKNFDDEKLMQLADSIKQHGVVQPIIVKKENDTYRIVAGERRWRAARIAGLTRIPVIVKDLTDRQLVEIALIENLQRQDLNPIEEAQAYSRLIEEFKMTQEDISKVVGKSRSAVANSIRLLNLSEEIRNYLIEGKLTSGHARALITIEDKDLQNKLAEEIIQKDLNVRKTENLVKKYLMKKPKKKQENLNEYLIEIQERFREIFGTKVRLVSNNKKGKIVLEYYSDEELERIVQLINSISKNT